MVGEQTEAERHLKSAKKAQKTTLTKWKVDHLKAAEEYNKAATCFLRAQRARDALAALEQVCECYKALNQLYHAAKALEQSALICRDEGWLADVPPLASRAALMYRQQGYPEAAVRLLKKAAKMLEQKEPSAAADLFEKAAETVDNEDRPREAAQYLDKSARLLVKAGQLEKASRTLERAISTQGHAGGSHVTLGKLVAELVILELAREDVIAAGKAYNKWGGYCQNEEAAVLKTVLDAIEAEDGAEAGRVLSHNFIKNLDVEYAVLAAKIELPDEESGLEAAAKAYGARRAAEIDSQNERKKSAKKRSFLR